MKTKVLIIAFLIVSLLGAFTLKANAQDSTKTLIADETWIMQLKTGAKITTYSEQVFKNISLKWGESFKAIHIYYKKDRNGPYKEYVILCSEAIGNNITDWSKSNL